MELSGVLFTILAAITCVSAVGVVVTQNIVRAATWLLFALAGTAGIYFLLGANFIGATQLLIYVGGTLVLVVFGVMLTAQGPFIIMRIGAAEWAIALVVGLFLYSVLAITLWQVNPPPEFAKVNQAREESAAEEGEPMQLAPSFVLGGALLGMDQATADAKMTGFPEGTREVPPRTRVAYLLPFEIVSVHLLVVLVGAAYLARAKRRRSAPALAMEIADEQSPVSGASS
jgi:NADH-quinone oxidoreductase subunit J